jgi:hypothetical protein
MAPRVPPIPLPMGGRLRGETLVRGCRVRVWEGSPCPPRRGFRMFSRTVIAVRYSGVNQHISRAVRVVSFIRDHADTCGLTRPPTSLTRERERSSMLFSPAGWEAGELYDVESHGREQAPEMRGGIRG